MTATPPAWAETWLRQVIKPAADIWYVAHVIDFIRRDAARTALQLGVQRQDAVRLVRSVRGALRSGSFLSGTVAGFALTIWAAGCSVGTLTVVFLAARGLDPHLLVAVRASGGLTEALALPIVMILPGVVLGTIGGDICASTSHLAPL